MLANVALRTSIVGVIPQAFIDQFRLGILNGHGGDLQAYGLTYTSCQESGKEGRTSGPISLPVCPRNWTQRDHVAMSQECRFSCISRERERTSWALAPRWSLNCWSLR
jgi:hypothetical protein